MKRASGPLLAAAMGAALIALLVYGLTARGGGRTLDEAVAHGQRPAAPDQPLPQLGRPGLQRLADYRGKVVVLNFWASWCIPCATEAPLLERSHVALLRHRGTVLGIAYRDTTSDSLSFVHRHQLTYPSLRDREGALAKAYGTQALPETFVLDRAGRIAAVSRGIVSSSFLARAVALAERP